MGAHFAKSKTVHSFNELSQDGAQALIDDIVAVYHYYCTGRIVLDTGENDEIQTVDVVGTEKYQLPTIPKSTLKNVDKCRDYFLKFVLGYSRGRYPDETEKTSEFDDWGIQFLPVLFEGKSIKHFNTAMYLDALKAQQDDGHYQVVQIRWQAIQAYFAGDIEKCVEYLEKALNFAKETNQPTWVIKDILVDLRNQHWTRCTAQNQYSDTPAQKELTESVEELYYPILDRIHESLHEKYIEGLYKKKTGSPYSVTLGNNLDQYGEMLASSLVVSMYNGSLTHILLIYEKIRDFVFYLSCKYDDWNLRLNLYINCVLDSEKEREQIKYSPVFLCVLRKQDRALTEEMDKKIAEHLSSYYEGTYKLETTEDENQDMPVFVKEYVERIRKSNETQGKGGVYFGHGTREIATVRYILSGKELICDADTMDMLISVVADTLLISKEGISTKLDAIALLVCIAVKYPEDYTRNQGIYEKLFEQQKVIEVADNSIISSNIDSISLKIGLQLLYTAIGKDVYAEMLESMPYIQGDIATTIAVTRLIVEYLEISDDVMFPSKVEAIILQNVLQWLHSEYADIRWNATRILLTMSRNPENYGIVNHQLVNLIDSNSVYIKNLIMRHLHKMNGITDGTKEHIISKCRHDANFVVRLVCDEVEKGVAEE